MENLVPKTKNQNNLLWKAGKLGNRIRMWNYVDEVLAESDVRDVTVRSKIPGDKSCFYRIPVDDLHKYNGSAYYYNESCPDEFLTMQGEICRMCFGWRLHYSVQPAPMRIALKSSGQFADGIQALGLLKYFTNPNGYEMLMDIFDIYDTHWKQECAVEFSCYSRNLGMFPNNNTIIWEVRGY